jgi:hypothetical protein
MKNPGDNRVLTEVNVDVYCLEILLIVYFFKVNNVF